MDYLKESKNFWKSYPKVKADADANYSVYKRDGCYFVSMYYCIENAELDAMANSAIVYSYSQLLRQLGTGKTFFFNNFYLS